MCSHEWISMTEFVRINEENGTLEVALRIYINDTKIISLLGMNHFAEASFYDQVEQIAKNKIVIYELSGCNFEQKEKQDCAIKKLPENYQDK